MDLPIPRKRNGSSRRISSNGNSIIEKPCDKMKYNRGNSHKNTNDCIKEVINPSELSSDTSSSHFSQGDEHRERKQQQRNNDKKEKQRRDRVKQQCAQSQQGWDKKRERRGFNLEGAYANTSKSFDGVRTDRPQNEVAADIVKKVRNLCTNDDSHLSHTKRRGGKHSPSALEGSGSKVGRKERNRRHSSPFGSTSDDPLDDVLKIQIQERNKKSSRVLGRRELTKKVGGYMDDISSTNSTIFGNGNMTTNRRKKKKKSKDREEVIDIDCEESNQGSGKKMKTSRYFGGSNHSRDSPSNSYSIHQDDDYLAEGWGSPDDKRNDKEFSSALKAANQSAYGTDSFSLKRDPKKSQTDKRSKREYMYSITLSSQHFNANILTNT